MINEPSTAPHCKACGHADPHDEPLFAAPAIHLCLQCFDVNRFCTASVKDYASLAYARMSRINNLQRRLTDAANNLDDMRQLKERAEIEAAEWCARAERAEAQVTELQGCATKRVLEWREERRFLHAEIERLAGGPVLWVDGRPYGPVESLRIKFEGKRA